MKIRRATSADYDAILDVWLQSVRSTHTFLQEKDIQELLPLVREGLPSCELWVLATDADAPMGFMGMSGSKIEALFLAPEFLRRGGGRQLVKHAQQHSGEVTVDVNEQNSAACRFYEACGFIRTGRSELDSTGRPFPLIHMRLPAPRRPG
jgi:putative acetyltransferase